jgi:ABC-2 type transport system permease protein
MNSLLIAGNIIKRVLKGPREIIALIVMPVILVGVIVVALRGTSGTTLKAGIVELDKGYFSSQMADYIKKQNVKVVELNEGNYISSLKQKKVNFAVVIPKGFSDAIANGKKVDIDFYSGSSDANIEGFKQLINQNMLRFYTVSETARTISSETGRDIKEIYGSLISETGKEQLKVDYRLAERNTKDTSAENPAIGFAVMFMMILIFTTIGVILEDKKNLTLARMFVSPVKEWEIILGNLLGSLALGILQLIPLTIILKICFKLNSISSITVIFAILLCFLVAIIGIGIGISGFIKKSLNPATLIATVITPTCILGGCFIPASMMPDIINKIGYAVPQKWVMGAMQSIFAGENFEAIAMNLIIILMFGIAFATFGLKTLKPLE